MWGSLQRGVKYTAPAPIPLTYQYRRSQLSSFRRKKDSPSSLENLQTLSFRIGIAVSFQLSFPLPYVADFYTGNLRKPSKNLLISHRQRLLSTCNQSRLYSSCGPPEFFNIFYYKEKNLCTRIFKYFTLSFSLSFANKGRNLY